MAKSEQSEQMALPLALSAGTARRPVKAKALKAGKIAAQRAAPATSGTDDAAKSPFALTAKVALMALMSRTARAGLALPPRLQASCPAGQSPT